MKASSTKMRNVAWKRAEAKVNGFTDALGKGIDARIKEAVVALNALGINTYASCEGHLNWATSAPYVDIEAGETKAILGLKRQYDRMSARRSSSDSLYRDLRKLSDRIERYNKKEVRKVLLLLSDFYKNRNVPYDQRVVIRSWSWGIGRLESQGVCILSALSGPERLRKLRLYQAEMHRFTAFLKRNF